jgi:hypothetical protein
MKNLAISFAMSLIASVLIYFGLYFGLGRSLHGEALVGLAAVPFVAVHHIYEALERNQTKRRIARSSENLPTLDALVIRWTLLICYGALIFLGINQLGTGLAAIVYNASGGNEELKLPFVAIVALAINVIGVYFLGRWFGVRSKRLGLVSLFFGILLGLVLSKATDFIFVPPAKFKSLVGMDKSWVFFLFVVVVGTVLYTSIAAIGLWRGRRRRLSRYLYYLLTLLPADSRATIVSLAYDEARLVTAKQSNAA